MLRVLFGAPGAGKTCVGRIRAREFGFRFHDADHELPPAMRQALARKLSVTDPMRDEFFERVVDGTRTRIEANECVAIARTFLKEKYRERMVRAFPDARFILIGSTPDLIEGRFAQRKNYLIDQDNARRLAQAFEPPPIPHAVLDNVKGDSAIIDPLAALLASVRSRP